MQLKRRHLMKTILLSPFLGLSKSIASAMSPPPSVPGYANMLIHGMFVTQMKYDDPNVPKLEITAPTLSSHLFIGGMRNNLSRLGNTPIDWSTGAGLTGGTPSNWPNGNYKQDIPPEVRASILQFSRTTTGVGDLSVDPKKYVGKIILPWPIEFDSLRCDAYPPLDGGGQKVADDIFKRCKYGAERIGVVTCFRYKCDFSGPVVPGSTPIVNYHFYLMPCDPNADDLTHVNNALAETANIFSNSPNFYLRMTKMNSTPSLPGDDCQQVAGIIPYDELAISEDPLPNSWCPEISKSKLHRKDGKRKRFFGPDPNVNPANCPNFYLGP